MQTYDSENWDWGAGFCRSHRGQELPCKVCIGAGCATLVGTPEPTGAESPSVQDTRENWKAGVQAVLNYFIPASEVHYPATAQDCVVLGGIGQAIQDAEKATWASDRPSVQSIPKDAGGDLYCPKCEAVRHWSHCTDAVHRCAICKTPLIVQDSLAALRSKNSILANMQRAINESPKSCGEILLPEVYQTTLGLAEEAPPPTMVSGHKTIEELMDSLGESREWIKANVVRFELITGFREALEKGLGFTHPELTIPETERVRAWIAEAQRRLALAGPPPTGKPENRVIRIKPTEADNQAKFTPAERAYDSMYVDKARREPYIRRVIQSTGADLIGMQAHLMAHATMAVDQKMAESLSKSGMVVRTLKDGGGNTVNIPISTTDAHAMTMYQIAVERRYMFEQWVANQRDLRIAAKNRNFSKFYGNDNSLIQIRDHVGNWSEVSKHEWDMYDPAEIPNLLEPELLRTVNVMLRTVPMARKSDLLRGAYAMSLGWQVNCPKVGVENGQAIQSLRMKYFALCASYYKRKVVPLKSLLVRADHMTKSVDADLMGDIELIGVIVPIHLRALGNDNYEILDGWRRVAAVRELGGKEIVAQIKKSSDLIPPVGPWDSLINAGHMRKR